MTRSALYAEALQLLLTHEVGESTVTNRLDAVYDAIDSGLDPVVSALQSEALQEDW